ncbi:hypothetical protein ACJIZ3_009023 [Penstemon smallii]|uniref:DOG1 domain-containing protein n=1 Tax=Penstemon smallii TaxID=265156 RepID=A0ABD3TBD1_9LAMI
MAALNHEHFQCCFKDWIAQQHEDLEELLTILSPDTNTVINDDQLKLLGQKSIKHFEEYCEKRTLLAKHHASSFMSPGWCSSFENAFLWIGGCRPSLFVRLIYSEEIADQPLAMLANRAERVGESSQDLDRAMDAHSVSLARIMFDADNLRLGTLKDLIAILTPLQTINFLVATKKLHLSMHEWGKRSDNQIGKPSSSNT